MEADTDGQSPGDGIGHHSGPLPDGGRFPAIWSSRRHQWHKDGQFWRGDDEDRVQIDYVQHNATAFLNWYLLHRA
jgi:hypothetical protein